MYLKTFKILELDPACFLPAQELSWQAALKKSTLKLDLLTYVNILCVLEKGIRRGTCHYIHWYAKAW